LLLLVPYFRHQQAVVSVCDRPYSEKDRDDAKKDRELDTKRPGALNC